MRGVGPHWVRAWPWKRVLVLWLGLSGVIVVTAITWVLPLPDGPLRLPFVAAKLLSPVAVFIVGAILVGRPGRPWLVVIGMVGLLWATITLGLGCPGRACRVPQGYEHWRNIKVAVDVGLGGPRLLITSEPGSCAFDCPYMIQLVPLAIGYFAYADALPTHE